MPDSSQLFNDIDVSVLVIQLDNGMIRHVNDCVCRTLNKNYETIVGVNYRHLFWPEFIPVFERLMNASWDGEEHGTIYYWAERAIWEKITCQITIWEDAPCLLMSVVDVSEVVHHQYQMERLNSFDNLLHLPNGARLEADINELANVETVALVFLTIEHFSDINELYGWDNGDSLLIQIKDWILASETRRAQVYRVHDGFAILGRKITMEDAKDRAREILRRFSKPWPLSTGDNTIMVYCTAKVGIVYGSYVKNEMRTLMLRTIRAAKKSRTGYAIYDEHIDRVSKYTLEMTDTLVSCIRDDMKGFEVHYQPIADVKSQRWTAVEALCRWTMPDGTRVPPADFIRTAEQLDLIDQIDAWVSRTAMAQCAALELPEKDFLLDVNFSPIQKIDDAFIGQLFQSLLDTGFPAFKLNLEITESAKMLFDEENIKGLNRLRESGIHLSLDDFGTGYSSFANLIKVSAHSLKTDKIFLDGIEHDAYRQYLLRILVDIAHHLNMKLIAEGVETEEQFDLLKRLGVDRVQGYYLGKPMPYGQLRECLDHFSIPADK